MPKDALLSSCFERDLSFTRCTHWFRCESFTAVRYLSFVFRFFARRAKNETQIKCLSTMLPQAKRRLRSALYVLYMKSIWRARSALKHRQFALS
jgi:hypothetical protein